MRRSRSTTARKRKSFYSELLFGIIFIGFSSIFFIICAKAFFSKKASSANGLTEAAIGALGGMAISGLFVLIGCFIVFSALRKRKAPIQDDSSYPKSFTSRSTQELMPKQAAKSAFIFLLLFAIVWLGVIYFVSQSPENTEQDTWTLGLVYLIGFVVSCAAIWNGMALFNPKTRFIVHSGHLKTGDKATVNWTIQGNTSAIQDMTIELIGQEKVTYRRGTDTMTDTSVFHRKTYRIPEREIHSQRGMFEIEIPKETMHSWESDNNAVIWALTVKGEIKMWPDMKENYELTIHP